MDQEVSVRSLSSAKVAECETDSFVADVGKVDGRRYFATVARHGNDFSNSVFDVLDFKADFAILRLKSICNQIGFVLFLQFGCRHHAGHRRLFDLFCRFRFTRFASRQCFEE